MLQLIGYKSVLNRLMSKVSATANRYYIDINRFIIDLSPARGQLITDLLSLLDCSNCNIAARRATTVSMFPSYKLQIRYDEEMSKSAL